MSNTSHARNYDFGSSSINYRFGGVKVNLRLVVGVFDIEDI